MHVKLIKRKCPFCGRECYDIWIHIAKNHLNEKCPICGQNLKKVRHKVKHLLRHLENYSGKKLAPYLDDEEIFKLLQEILERKTRHEHANSNNNIVHNDICHGNILSPTHENSIATST